MVSAGGTGKTPKKNGGPTSRKRIRKTRGNRRGRGRARERRVKTRTGRAENAARTGNDGLRPNAAGHATRLKGGKTTRRAPVSRRRGRGRVTVVYVIAVIASAGGAGVPEKRGWRRELNGPPFRFLRFAPVREFLEFHAPPPPQHHFRFARTSPGKRFGMPPDFGLAPYPRYSTFVRTCLPATKNQSTDSRLFDGDKRGEGGRSKKKIISKKKRPK